MAARFAAAVLWLDVSGFTALSEMLGEQGPAGAERLSELLNERFGALIAVIARHGGDITHFAGDAICAVWPLGADAAPETGCAALRGGAGACRRYPTTPADARRAALRVRAASLTGDCAWTVLGGDDEGFFVVGGAPPAHGGGRRRGRSAGRGGRRRSRPGRCCTAQSKVARCTPAGDRRLSALHDGDGSIIGAEPSAPRPVADTVVRFLPRVLRERLACRAGGSPSSGG